MWQSISIKVVVNKNRFTFQIELKRALKELLHFNSPYFFMSTLFNRIYSVSKTNSWHMLAQPQRIELGKKVAEEYHKSGNTKPLRYTKAKEFDWPGSVLYYPPEFTPRMDKLIEAFYKKIEKKRLKGLPF